MDVCVKLGKLLYFFFANLEEISREALAEWLPKPLAQVHLFILGVYADIRTKTLTHYLEYAYQCKNSPLEQQGVITCSKQVGQDCRKLSEIVLRRIQNNLAEMIIR